MVRSRRDHRICTCSTLVGMKKLCCLVNTVVVCEACETRWCLDCWNGSEWQYHLGTASYGDRIFTCPTTKKQVKWRPWTADPVSRLRPIYTMNLCCTVHPYWRCSRCKKTLCKDHPNLHHDRSLTCVKRSHDWDFVSEEAELDWYYS